MLWGLLRCPFRTARQSSTLPSASGSARSLRLPLTWWGAARSRAVRSPPRAMAVAVEGKRLRLQGDASELIPTIEEHLRAQTRATTVLARGVPPWALML